jgi:bifunctional DNA-binding transcriptional regulator/antitoxin component of YhaV-PrlF toxin-antitoxin module
MPRVTSDGRITVPAAVRSRIGDQVLLVVDVDRNRLLLADANSAFLALVTQLEGKIND